MSQKSSTHHEYHSEVHSGNHEDMLLAREKQIKPLRKTIDDVLKDWDGQPFVFITARDDGKGSTNVRGCGGGVGNANEAMALIKAMGEQSEKLQKQIASMGADVDPMEVLAQLLGRK